MNTTMLRYRTCRAISTLLQTAVLLAWAATAMGAELPLERAIDIAQQRDPWIQGSQFRQQSLLAQSHSAGSLPDPVVSTGFANLPTDTFDFNQEPMTQFAVGVTQAIPRGNSLALKRDQLAILGNEQSYQRVDRRARVRATVAELWLDAWQAQATIRLIEAERYLFEQLSDIAQSNYINSLNGTRQQDIVHAQVELIRLEDRLVLLHEDFEVAGARLQQWLAGSEVTNTIYKNVELPRSLPSLAPGSLAFFAAEDTPEQQVLADMLMDHPALQIVERKIEASSTEIEIAEQGYRPQWRLNASYAYRDDDPLGAQRADFFSFGVSFDLPLFTARRQDQQVISARATTESIRTERALLLRQMIAELRGLHTRLQRLTQRQALYKTRLLDEVAAQVAASMEAYTNDDGDFTEVARAKIAQLYTQIDALAIDVDRQKTIAKINYFFASSSQLEDQ